MSIECQINAAMAVCGITPLASISFDGKLRRFGKNKSGWCVFFDGHIKAGAFGDWRTGVSEKFIESRQDITAMDRQRITKQMRDAAAQREHEKRTAQQQAANDCASIWASAGELGSNGYLVSNGLKDLVSDYGMRNGRGSFGSYTPFGVDDASLLVPVVDVYEAIHSIQFISTDGLKRFYPDGKLRGHFYPIALTHNPKKVLICEGIATALTLHEYTSFPVIAAFNCGNLAPVAESIRWKYSKANILICGDDDHYTEGNPGRTKAIEAAARCGGDWVLPDFTGLPRSPKDTDFNDLWCLQGNCHG